MARNNAVAVEKKPVTWILVADGRKAQVYTRSQQERRIPMSGNSTHPHYQEVTLRGLIPVEGMAWRAEDDSEYEFGLDKMGRSFESSSPARHMYEPHVDIHEQIKRRFMRSVAEHMNAAKASKGYDRLILVVPAKMLGELRTHLNDKVQHAIIAELAKDMTHHDERALVEQIDQIL